VGSVVVSVPKLAFVWVASLLRVAGCGDDDGAAPVEPIAAIAGTVTLHAAPEPHGARAAAYAGVAAFDAGLWTRETTVARDGAGWRFDLEIDPGSYYVDVWMDSDADGQISAGDIYGYYAVAPGGAPAAVQVEAARRTAIVVAAGLVAASSPPRPACRAPVAQSVPGKFWDAKSQSSK
jgi:hypothetical protein